MQLIVDNLLTSYTESGKGDRVALFLHGWADNSKTYQDLIRELSGAVPDLKIVALDLPGFGGTQQPPEAWSLEEYADFTASFLDKLGKKAEIIVGHSNGGAIAMKAVAEGRVSAEKLVLIGSAGVRPRTLKRALLKTASIPARLFLGLLPAGKRAAFRRKIYGAIGSDYLIAEHMQETFVKVVSEDLREQAGELSIPTCLIYGRQDEATPIAIGQALAKKIPDSEMNVIEDAGHFVHQEKAKEVAVLIKGFIG